MGSLSQSEINHNIKYNTLNGIFATMGLNLVTPFISVWAMGLGATNFQIGLISSLPPLVGLVAMLPGAFFVDRFSAKRNITGAFMFFTRLFYILLALTPILPAHQVWFLVIMNGLMNFPGSISNVAWQSFIAGAIPAQQRAHAFAQRNRLTHLFGIAVTFLAGQIFRVVPVARHSILYQIFFVTAFVIALAEVWSHMQMREVVSEEVAGKAKLSTRQTFKAILTARPFLIFCACSLVFHFGWQMGWPLFSIYQVRNLGANETWVSIISVVSGAGSFFSFGLWRRLIEKRGNHVALAVSAMGISSTPFLYAISSSLYQLILANALVGIAVAGIGLTLFNSLLDAVPEQSQTIYIAAYTMLINISAVIAPMVGIAILDRWNIIAALLVAGTVRLLGTCTFFLRSRKISKVPGQEVAA